MKCYNSALSYVETDKLQIKQTMIKGESNGGASEFNRYRGSSKTFLILCMPVVILFLVGHIIKMAMTDGGTIRMANISDKVALFL